MASVMIVNDTNFESEVEKAQGVTVVDFWAPWCGPCRMVGPIIEKLSKEYDGRVKFTKLNVDENPVTASSYGIRSIPTIGIFKDGAPADGVVGAVPQRVLADAIDRNLAA